MAVRGPSQDPASVEVGQDRHHVLPARPGGVTQRRRGQRSAAGGIDGRRRDLAIGRGRIGEIRFEDDDPAGPLEGADGVGRAAGCSRGVRQWWWRRDRKSAFQASHGGVDRGVRRRRERTGPRPADRRPVTDQPAVRHEPVDEGGPGRRGGGPVDRRAPPERRRSDHPSPGQVQLRVDRGQHVVLGRSLDVLGDPERSGPDGRERPVEVEPGSLDRRGVAGLDGGAEPGDPLRGLTTAGDAASRHRIEHDRPDDPFRTRRSAQHQAVARRDRDRRRETNDGATRPVRQLEGVAPAPSHGRICGRGPEVDPGPRTIGQGRGEPDEDPVARHDGRVVGQDQAAMEIARLDTGEVQRGATRPGDLDGGVVDLDLADAGRPVAWHETQGGASGDRSATKRAGHDHATTLDREDAVDGQARPACRRDRHRTRRRAWRPAR